MRITKFRAWDKGSDRMAYQYDMNGLENKEYCFSLNEDGVELLHYDEDYSAYVRCEAEIMQYTGLKDIEGNEIYEGDIVEKEFLDFGNKDNFIGVVKFENGSFIVDNAKLKRSYYLFSETDINDVVGNIYENPELLKSKF